MLEYTNTPGIHYADYPGTSNLMCIESSHLGKTDAVKYTTELVKILKEEKGWQFARR